MSLVVRLGDPRSLLYKGLGFPLGGGLGREGGGVGVCTVFSSVMYLVLYKM